MLLATLAYNTQITTQFNSLIPRHYPPPNNNNNNSNSNSNPETNAETKTFASEQEEHERTRLFSGLKAHEGFLQIYNATLREWTWLCDEQFNLHAAAVACKQLRLEHRNPLVRSLFYYTAPWEQLPIWNQTFVCDPATDR